MGATTRIPRARGGAPLDSSRPSGDACVAMRAPTKDADTHTKMRRKEISTHAGTSAGPPERRSTRTDTDAPCPAGHGLTRPRGSGCVTRYVTLGTCHQTDNSFCFVLKGAKRNRDRDTLLLLVLKKEKCEKKMPWLRSIVDGRAPAMRALSARGGGSARPGTGLRKCAISPPP